MVPGLEMKFAGGPPVLTDGQVIEGYASLFGLTDQGGDAVLPGAFAASLARIAARGDKVRMLWQHDGLSIGYRTLRAERDKAGRRVLAEVELWEVSLVTFPMLAEAKVDRKDSDEMRDVAALFVQAAQALRGA